VRGREARQHAAAQFDSPSVTTQALSSVDVADAIATPRPISDAMTRAATLALVMRETRRHFFTPHFVLSC